MAMNISSNSFKDNQYIPSEYAYDRDNRSPQLSWSDVPAGTKSYVLICDDPDAPVGTWIHWVVYDIPSGLKQLQAGFPAFPVAEYNIRQGTNSYGQIGYGGPCPPRGPAHRYFFKLYALDIQTIGLPAGAKATEVENRMRGYILAEAQIIGKYRR